MDNTNFDRFINKSNEIVSNQKIEGATNAEAEREVAHYFGMSKLDYRITRSAAIRARRAREAFEVHYYRGTHPDASIAEIALALDLTEVHVKALIDHE